MARNMDKRIPVSKETQDRMNKFRKGAGGTYDDALNLLLDIVVAGRSEQEVGAMLNYAVTAGKQISIPEIVSNGEAK